MTGAEGPAAAPWLELRAVTRRFRDGVRGEVLAAREVSLVVGRGEVVALAGPSGSGKSTVVALAAGLLLPTRGDVLFASGAFSRLREAFRARLRRRRMGVLLQHLALVPGMSALENALLPAVPDGGIDRAAIDAALAALARFDVAPLARARVETLSGGERQRVALARALRPGPDLLVLDEPTAHLDAGGVARVASHLAEHAARGGGALVASHDPRLLASPAVTRTLAMAAGRVEGAG